MIQASNIFKSFGDVQVMNDVSFNVKQGEGETIGGKVVPGKALCAHSWYFGGNLIWEMYYSEGQDLSKLSQ
nr:hypothetical protein [Candidatus Brachybacter algidus]